jgi:hypothetical protein
MSSSSTNYVYNPTTSNISEQLDTLIEFAKIGNELKRRLGGNITPYSIAVLRDSRDEAEQKLFKQYSQLKEKFEKIEKIFLVESARTLGFEEREFLIKPLKDLVEKIKTMEVTPDYAIQQLTKLIKTMGVNKIINNVGAVPYVGEVAEATMKNLDNFTQAQPVIEKMIDLLIALGVDSSQVQFIKNYTSDNFITSKYKGFQNMLAEGELFNFSSPFNSIKNSVSGFAVKLGNTVYHFFVPTKDEPTQSQPQSQPEQPPQQNIASVTVQEKEKEQQPQPAIEPSPEPTKKDNAYVGGEILNRFNKKNRKNKTKREIYNINQTIKSHLLRLGRTVRTPFHKSVTSRKVKRRF